MLPMNNINTNDIDINAVNKLNESGETQTAADFQLICFIVNYGTGSKIIKSAKSHGISGGTATMGKGTANNRILEFLGLSDIRKEIIFLICSGEIAEAALTEMNDRFELDKPNHGIAFTTSVCGVLGSRHNVCDNIKNKKGAAETMYQAIITIVDKGKAEFVIDAATAAGSKGGTIINGRGSGIHETTKLFNMEIEPEKEIVIIISDSEKTGAITESITKELRIDEPGNGIIFVQNVNKTYGLYK